MLRNPGFCVELKLILLPMFVLNSMRLSNSSIPFEYFENNNGHRISMDNDNEEGLNSTMLISYRRTHEMMSVKCNKQ